jgi:hypothetical protein
VVFVPLSHAEKNDQRVESKYLQKCQEASNYLQKRQKATADMHDTHEEMEKWKPLAEALRRCEEIVEPKYCCANRVASRYQTQHKRITFLAALCGAAAVVIAILQLPEIFRALVLLGALVVRFSIIEGIAALVTFVLVLLGIFTLQQKGWIIRRHLAERFKFLKFRFLIDPQLWGVNAVEREMAERRLKEKLDEILQSTRDELLSWSEKSILPEEPTHLKCSHADAHTLCNLVDYYLAKRCSNQLEYFDRKTKEGSGRSQLLHALPHILFFVSIFAALTHFSLDTAGAAIKVAPAIELSVILILIAAVLPVIGAGVRTVQSAFEIARNKRRYKAVGAALKLSADRLEDHLQKLSKKGHTTVNAHDCFREMWRCEQILKAEHREWLRLMMEAEWFG